MKKHSKNPNNYYSKYVDKIDEHSIREILEVFMEHIDSNDGDFLSLVNTKLTDLAMKDIFYYIFFQMNLGVKSENLFDYFNIARYEETHTPDANDDIGMQEWVATTSEEDSPLESANPYAETINNMDERVIRSCLRELMEYIKYNGGVFGALLHKAMTDAESQIFAYISAERRLGFVPEDLFDYFNIARYEETHTPDANDDIGMHEWVATTSEEDSSPEPDPNTYLPQVQENFDRHAHVNDADRQHVSTSHPTVSWPALTITLDLDIASHMPVALSLDLPIHVSNSGLNHTGIAPFHSSALSYGDESHDGQLMDQVVALDESGTPEEASYDVATLLLASILSSGSILGMH